MMAETQEGIKESFGSESKSERQSPFIRRLAPLVKRLGPFAAPLILTVAAACSEGGESLPSQEILQPPTTTPAAAQTIEAQPTIKATVTPTASPAAESAKPTLTAEKPPSPKGNWVVEVDPAVVGPSRFRTVEEDLAIINRVSENFPKTGNLKIILTSRKAGSVDLRSSPEAIIYLAREAFSLEPHVYHEFGHFFDVTINAERLRPFYTREDWKRLFELRAAIVARHRNFPQIEKMFAPEKLTTQKRVAEITKYPDALFIDHTRIWSEINGGQPPQEPLFANLLKDPLLEQFAQETKWQRHGYLNFGQFFEGEKARIDQLKAANPYWHLALGILETKLDYLANWQWSALTGLPLAAVYLDQYFAEALPLYARMALTQALSEDNRQLLSLLGPEETANKKEQYFGIYIAATNELFAEVYSRQLAGPVPMEDEVAQYHNLINNRAKP